MPSGQGMSTKLENPGNGAYGKVFNNYPGNNNGTTETENEIKIELKAKFYTHLQIQPSEIQGHLFFSH